MTVGRALCASAVNQSSLSKLTHTNKGDKTRLALAGQWARGDNSVPVARLLFFSLVCLAVDESLLHVSQFYIGGSVSVLGMRPSFSDNTL